MSETDNFTYMALITISLPADGETVRIPVVLTPASTVLVAGQHKVLGECTLADLRSYAADLEKEVWDAFEAITLPELDDDETIAVEVVLSSDPSEQVAEWPQQIILLPTPTTERESDQNLNSEEADSEAETEQEQEEALFVADKLTVSEVVAADEEEHTEDLPETVEADVAVAETELVYPEIEEEIFAEVDAAFEPRPIVAEIIPSKARVRVAGAQLPYGHPTQAAVDILMDEPALRAAQAHALSSMNREVAGVLVGPRPEKQPDGRYLVHIFDTIVAKHTVMQGASVTYTPESWRYLNDTMWQRYPDDTAVMVGWYHTHPGFGIFLSGMDLFIHQNFFTQIWHVAMVLDPRARTSGFFCWDRAKSQVSRCDFGWPSWAAGSW